MNNKSYYTSDMAYEPDDDYEPCSKKLLPSLFAWFLLISSTSSYFTLVFPVYYDLLGPNKFHLFVTLAITHVIIFIYVLVNFCISTFMDPGRFPKTDVIDNGEGLGKTLSSSNYKNVLINDINVRMKWCNTCLFYRPPRSSHCAVCNSCIDTMDHHCPWVSNCIGKRNYKYFFAFLVSLSIHMLSILSMSILLVWLNKNNLSNVPMLTAIILIILITVLIIPIGGLTGFHAVLVSRGRTTNEQVTGKFRTGVNPFDEGIMKNCAKILFTSSPPSYLEFKRNQKKMREYYEAKILLEKYSRSKNGRLIRNTDSNNVVSPQRYKNPNFYANKAETKRVRSQNHHEQNELELKYNNYLNEDYFAQSRKSTNGNRDLINKIKKKEMLQYARNDSYTSASQNLLTNDMVKSRPRDYISKKVIRPNSVDSDDRVNLNSYEITV